SALVVLGDLAATRAHVTQHVAIELFGRADLEPHQRLHQHRVRLLHSRLERHRAGRLERHLARVDIVVVATSEDDAHVDHGVARDDATFERATHTFFDRLDELLGHLTANDLVDELEALAAVRRLDLDAGDAVLAVAAGLAHEA